MPEPYPPYHLIDYAKAIDLRYVFGSDAHTVTDLHQHYDTIFNRLTFLEDFMFTKINYDGPIQAQYNTLATQLDALLTVNQTKLPI